jgi:hypothetical protein
MQFFTGQEIAFLCGMQVTVVAIKQIAVPCSTTVTNTL